VRPITHIKQPRREEEEDLATERAQDRAEDKAKNEAGVDGLNVEDANDDEFPAKGA
jgi:hypothetical protein